MTVLFSSPTPLAPVPDRGLSLGFLTPHDPFDRTAFSGTAWHAAEALANTPGVTLRLLGPSGRSRHRLARLVRRFRAAPPVPVDLTGLDAVVGLVATSLLDRLSQSTDLPFLHVTDATPQFLVETYGRRRTDEDLRRETRVAARSTCVYSSAAMAARAPRDLGLPDLKPQVLPFGVNLSNLPPVPPQKPPLDRLELLFVGLDWERKGGDIALAALDHLNAAGRKARLTVIGPEPGHATRHPQVRAMGFLDKGRASDAQRLSALYARAHLLLLPTRGDCTPMFIDEAMAHGTPVLATDTGGVAEAVGAPGAGATLPRNADAVAWADHVAALTGNPLAWALLSDAARDYAKARFSWETWAEGIAHLARARSTGQASPKRRVSGIV